MYFHGSVRYINIVLTEVRSIIKNFVDFYEYFEKNIRGVELFFKVYFKMFEAIFRRFFIDDLKIIQGAYRNFFDFS